MSYKKIVGKIHLWLGLSSGLVVLFLGITGCILAFEIEIRNLTESFRKVKIEDKPFLLPSALKTRAEKHLVLLITMIQGTSWHFSIPTAAKC